MVKKYLATEKSLTIGIVGLGLIGGSLARAFRLGCPAVNKIIAFDIAEEGLTKAKTEGVIDEALFFDSSLLPKNENKAEAFLSSILKDEAQKKLLHTLHTIDVIFLCVPAEEIGDYAHSLAQHTNALLTDVGSVKSPVLEKTKGLRFIGGHPMAGSERCGYSCSLADLFENAVYVMCPPDSFFKEEKEKKKFEDDLSLLWYLAKSLGAAPLILNAHEHDQAVAAISHLPHIVASSLVNAALSNEKPIFQSLAAGGFRDITRIAGSDARLWTGISLESKRYLVSYMKKFQTVFSHFIHALELEKAEELQNLFSKGAQLRENLPVSGCGALNAPALLRVDIDDIPGELGKVTVLLGSAGISIKNISIQDAREYEGGCLRLYLRDTTERERAQKLLEEKDFVCYY